MDIPVVSEVMEIWDGSDGSLHVESSIFDRRWEKFNKDHIYPGRLTWNLRIHPWKRKIIFQTIIFRFYVNLPGCTLGFQTRDMRYDWTSKLHTFKRPFISAAMTGRLGIYDGHSSLPQTGCISTWWFKNMFLCFTPNCWGR